MNKDVSKSVFLATLTILAPEASDVLISGRNRIRSSTLYRPMRRIIKSCPDHRIWKKSGVFYVMSGNNDVI